MFAGKRLAVAEVTSVFTFTQLCVLIAVPTRPSSDLLGRVGHVAGGQRLDGGAAGLVAGGAGEARVQLVADGAVDRASDVVAGFGVVFVHLVDQGSLVCA